MATQTTPSGAPGLANTFFQGGVTPTGGGVGTGVPLPGVIQLSAANPFAQVTNDCFIMVFFNFFCFIQKKNKWKKNKPLDFIFI